MDGVASIIESIEVANSQKERVLGPDWGSLLEYADWVQRIETAIGFFEEHRRIKDAKLFLNRLGEHRAKAARELTKACER